jgi:hypothetical protein
MEPVALALLTQRPSPLQMNFMKNPVQFLLAMMKPEVLVEALKHRPQMTLLVTPSPVHMLNQPRAGARKELAAALHAGESDHREPLVAVDSADVLEAEKLERLRLPAVPRTPLGGEPAKEQQPSLLLGELQIESCQALPELSPKGLRVRQMLETYHEVINETHEISLAPTPRSKSSFEPQVERVVQVDVGEDA